MRVLIAPDSFGGVLPAGTVAVAAADGWREVRPDDTVHTLPLSDGGEGLLDVLAALHPAATRTTVEVAGTDTRPVRAPVLWLDARTAVLETARICGLPPADVPRRPLEATSYGVGQALTHVVEAGAEHVIVGLGGTGVVDGGSGALNGLGMRLRRADGSGLRVGAADLAECTGVDRGWARWPDGVRLDLLADTDVPVTAAVARYGPQKGLATERIGPLAAAVAGWADVLTAAFPGRVGPDTPHTGAAGGLGLALAVALGGRLTAGATWVAERAGLDGAVATADLVVTGEGRLDATTTTGKVVDEVARTARRHGRPVGVVAGTIDTEVAARLGIAERLRATAPATAPTAAPATGAGDAAVAAVRAAGRLLASRITSVHSEHAPDGTPRA